MGSAAQNHFGNDFRIDEQDRVKLAQLGVASQFTIFRL
jgi:hypothetical protein